MQYIATYTQELSVLLYDIERSGQLQIISSQYRLAIPTYPDIKMILWNYGK